MRLVTSILVPAIALWMCASCRGNSAAYARWSVPEETPSDRANLAAAIAAERTATEQAAAAAAAEQAAAEAAAIAAAEQVAAERAAAEQAAAAAAAADDVVAAAAAEAVAKQAAEAAAEAEAERATSAKKGEAEARTAAVGLYRTRCAACHGPHGHGDGAAAVALNPKPRDFGDEAWQKSVTNTQIERTILLGGAAVGKSPLMPANADLAGKPEVVRALRKMVRKFSK